MRKGRVLRDKRIIPLGLLVAMMVFLGMACEPSAEEVTEIPSTIVTESLAEEDWLKVYFTEPTAEYSGSYRGGPDAQLAEAISGARLTVEVAIYNMNLWSVRNTLMDAHARGVIVRVVTDSDNIEGEEFQDLIKAGIAVIGDRHEGSMHNKFVVIDRAEVWTGSMNFTLNGAYEDNNNLLAIQSTEIAENYLVEFNEMFVDDMFGDESPRNTPHPEVTIGETVVETYFSPEDRVEGRLVDLILEAEDSIHFMAYSFTADTLSEAIRAVSASGVNVTGVMEEEQALNNDGSEYEPFLQAALDIRLDGNDGQMHHKVIIIDEKIVITGSYNFSRNAAEINDENVIIIHSTGIAAKYLDEFFGIMEGASIP